MDEKSMQFANFNITFGENDAPMLKHFSDIIFPAFSGDYIRGKRDSVPRYFFAGVEIKEVDNEYVMVGNFIKETQYKVVTTVQEGVLASTPADVPTAPYSRFIVFLKNHRMVLVRNETASPDTRSFQSTVRDILNQYVRNANRERSERDKLPIAIANIVDIPLKDSIADVLKNVNKVSWFKLRFFPLNNDLDPGPLTQHIREDMKKVGSKTTNIVFNSPNSKDGISKMIAESSGLAVASLQIVDNTGEKRRVKAMVRKMKEGKITRSAVVQAVNSWLGFARWACAYNLAKKIFAPYRFIKTEGAIPYGAISRNRQARRLLQQRRDLEAPYKTVAS